MNPWLGALECKPIDGGIRCVAPTTSHDTGLEPAWGYIFHPNKGRIMDSHKLIPMINCGKYSYGSSTWKTAVKCHSFAKEIVIRLYDQFSLLNSC